jgi:hypothetical protein
MKLGHSRRISRRTYLAVSMAIALVATVVALGVGSSRASAATGYSISSGTWNVRGCPVPSSCGVDESIGSGPLSNLVCQVAGTTVSVPGFGTSAVWDLVRAPSGRLGYVSDLAVAETAYARFDTRMPRCDAPSQPAATSAASSSYAWMWSCTGKVIGGSRWACWTAGLKFLFTPLPAS